MGAGNDQEAEVVALVHEPVTVHAPAPVLVMYPLAATLTFPFAATAAPLEV